MRTAVSKVNEGTPFDPALVAVRMLDKFPSSAHRRALGLAIGYPDGDPLRTYWKSVAQEIRARKCLRKGTGM